MQKHYTLFLQRGLVTLRNNATEGNRDALKALAEVLHNVPSLLTQNRPGPHEYFLRAEAAAFREALEKMPAGLMRNECELVLRQLRDLEAAISEFLARPDGASGA